MGEYLYIVVETFLSMGLVEYGLTRSYNLHRHTEHKKLDYRPTGLDIAPQKTGLSPTGLDIAPWIRHWISALD